MEYINLYIYDWNKADAPKPVNEPEFIAAFTELAKDADFDQWGFYGENNYCGYTATLSEYSKYIPVRGLDFEFAYGRDFVKVFTGNHNGFWTPEYIDLKGEAANELLAIIKDKLICWSGFGNN